MYDDSSHSGVTYIGPRAFVIAFCAIGGIFLAVFFGLNGVTDPTEATLPAATAIVAAGIPAAEVPASAPTLSGATPAALTLVTPLPVQPENGRVAGRVVSHDVVVKPEQPRRSEGRLGVTPAAALGQQDRTVKPPVHAATQPAVEEASDLDLHASPRPVGIKPVAVTKPFITTKPVAVTKAVSAPKPVAVTKTVSATKPIAVTKAVIATKPIAVTKAVITTKPVAVTKPVIVAKLATRMASHQLPRRLSAVDRLRLLIPFEKATVLPTSAQLAPLAVTRGSLLIASPGASAPQPAAVVSPSP